MTPADHPGLVLRPADEEECPEIVALLRKAFGRVAESLKITPRSRPEFPAFETVERLRSKARANKWRMYLLVEDGRPVGCGACSLDPDDPELGGVHRVAVDPACQGKGYGLRLVQDLENELKRMGARRVRLMHTTENADLHQFYHRLGYLTVHVDPPRDGRFGTTYMEREL